MDLIDRCLGALNTEERSKYAEYLIERVSSKSSETVAASILFANKQYKLEVFIRILSEE